jgi:truncated hemoglobin YjbI
MARTASSSLGVPPALAHRAFRAHAPGFRPFRSTDLLERIGGQPAADALVEALYDRFEADGVLRPLFGRDLENERAKQKLFFAEWLGGPRRYSDASHAGLVHRHVKLLLERGAGAGRWVLHPEMRRSSPAVGQPSTPRAAGSANLAPATRAGKTTPTMSLPCSGTGLEWVDKRAVRRALR